MKKKAIIILASIIGSAGVVGGAFAGWVITQGASETAPGTIKIDSIVDNRVSATIEWAAADQMPTDTEKTQIVYGYDSARTKLATDWLVVDEDAVAEDLSATLNISLSNWSAVDKVTAYLSVDEGSADKWAEMAGEGKEYVALPTNAGTALAPIDITDAFTEGIGNTATGSVAYAFRWGEHFGGGNPYSYYNAHDFDEILTGTTTYADDALASLQEMKTSLDGVTFTVTVSVSAKTGA